MKIKELLSVLFILLLLPFIVHTISQPAFRVTAVTTVVTPVQYSGNCPASFIFAAKITTNAKGRVRYQWLQSDGHKGPVEQIDFEAAGSNIVTSNWLAGEPGRLYTNLWKTIVIISPNRLTAPKPQFSLQCADKPDKNLRGDIDVSDITLDPQCRIHITHTNRGEFRINLVLREMMWLNGQLMNDSTEVIHLEAGESLTHSKAIDPRMITNGSASVRVMIDVDNVLTELNEVNNIMVKRLRCKSKEEID